MTRRPNHFETIKFESIASYQIGVRSNTFDPQKQSVVLVHGIGVSSAYFVPLARELAREHNVFALDLPGYGKAPKPRRPLTIEELSELVHAFLEAHSLGGAIAIGHSMGCQIIAELLANHGDDISKAILLAPTANAKERTRLKQGMRLFQDTFIESPRTNFVIFSDYARMGVLRYLKTSGYMVRHRIEDALARSSVPTIIIRGADDVIVPEEWTRYLQQNTSTVLSVKHIPGAPHAFHFNHASETAQLCSDFIEN